MPDDSVLYSGRNIERNVTRYVLLKNVNKSLKLWLLSFIKGSPKKAKSWVVVDGNQILMQLWIYLI